MISEGLKAIWTGSPAEYRAHCAARDGAGAATELRCKTWPGPPRKPESAIAIADRRDQTAPFRPSMSRLRSPQSCRGDECLLPSEVAAKSVFRHSSLR